MTTRETLIAARALIDTPEKWTQTYDARDANDEEADPLETAAVCFCMGGAVIRAGLHDFNARDDALRLLRKVTIGDDTNTTVYPWNDAEGRTHAEVLAAFDKAIASAA